MRTARLIATMAVLAGVVVLAPRALGAFDKTAAAHAELAASRAQVAECPGEASLLSKTLAATGRGAKDIAQCEQWFAAHVRRLRASGSVAGDTRQRAAAVHGFLHRELLRGTFDPAASDAAVAMSGGPYNCASATVLSLALLREFDVEARAVSVVGHVWCRFKTPEGWLDVETTCRDWYVLAERRAARPDEAALRSPQWREHLRRAAAGRTLDESAFLAIFHYNRGVRMMRDGQFAAAAAANLAALCLDWRCRPAYENLAAALGGWSASSSVSAR